MARTNKSSYLPPFGQEPYTSDGLAPGGRRPSKSGGKLGRAVRALANIYTPAGDLANLGTSTPCVQRFIILPWQADGRT